MLEYPLLCRLCGLKTENGLYIYCDEGKRRQVETKIRLYLHFQVLPSDSLPKKICASCFEELEGMHRFAINALKVQDNLARLSKELPMTAIDVCKSFSINYTDHAMAVSDTIASLNSEEVTEMEVQVDPMVFLEDDQIDDQDNQDSQDNQENQNNQENQENQDITQHLEQGAIAALEGGHLNLQHNEHTETGKNEEALTSNADDSSKLVSSENDQEKDQAKSTINQNEVVDTHSHQRKLIPQICENAKADKDHTVGDSKQGVQQGLQEQQQPPPDEVAKIEANGRNGNLTGAPDKQHLTLPDVAAPLEPGEIRREKKGMVVIKNSKKIESKSTSTENIKCTTYTCPICKKVVMKKGLFKAHLETHKTDHKFACEICMRVFKKEINLIRHRKSHSELTTYPCAHCNRVYPTKSTLRSHLVSHSDERPHVCSICSKSFKRNQDLKFHLNQHNGLRPYRCPYCTKAFASSGNCFSHRRRAHMKEIERDRALKKSDESAN